MVEILIRRNKTTFEALCWCYARRNVTWRKPTFLVFAFDATWRVWTNDSPLHKHHEHDSRQAIDGLKLEVPLRLINWWGSNGPPQFFGASFCPPSLTPMWKASMLKSWGPGEGPTLNSIKPRLKTIIKRKTRQRHQVFFFPSQLLFLPSCPPQTTTRASINKWKIEVRSGVCNIGARGSRPVSSSNKFGFKSNNCHM